MLQSLSFHYLQIKLGLGTRYCWVQRQKQDMFGQSISSLRPRVKQTHKNLTSLPVYLISPDVRLNENTAIVSLSWLATIRNCPLWSNWKWRGVSPLVWKKPTWVRVPLIAFPLLPHCFTRKMVMDSCPRLLTMTNRPDWWTQIRPQVFIVVGKADGTVFIDWISLSVERPLNASTERPSFEAREISERSSVSIAKTAT